MAKEPIRPRDADHGEPQPQPPAVPAGRRGAGAGPKRQGRLRPKGWLQAIAERLGAYPTED
jgi:hypothetical protein